MNHKFFGVIVFLTFLILSACRQQEVDQGVIEVINSQEQAEPAATDVPTPTPAPEAGAEEAAVPEVFVPITVDDIGITTVVPEGWPPIEGDPLLKNAWGPGEFRFVAFHTFPGLDASSAMAELLGIELDELRQNSAEGTYWEERIGRYDWALYNIDNPDIGLGQSVAMTIQDGTVYIVSLFVEMDDRDVVLNAVLDNFVVEGGEVGQIGAGGAEESRPEESETVTKLLAKDWVLELLLDGSGEVYDVLPGTELTIVFKSDRRVTGSAGCNDFASTFTLDKETLTITAPAKTRMSCEEPQGIMVQETQYLNNLSAVNAYQIKEDQLLLLNEEGNAILEYSAR